MLTLKVSTLYRYKINTTKFYARLNKSFLMPPLMSFAKMNNTTLADALTRNSRSQQLSRLGRTPLKQARVPWTWKLNNLSPRQNNLLMNFTLSAIRTSKQVAGTLKLAKKAKQNTERMEMEFQPNEQSIKHMVAREVQKSIQTPKRVCFNKNKETPRQSSGDNRKSRSTSRNRTRNGKKQAKVGRNRSSSAPGQTQNAQSRWSQSVTNSWLGFKI